jgi:hypothetical protein
VRPGSHKIFLQVWTQDTPSEEYDIVVHVEGEVEEAEDVVTEAGGGT